jgi:peptidoglycan LD-endopeptidase CwlK
VSLSDLSEQRLAACHPDLQKLVQAVAAVMPIAVLVGFRGEDAQNAAVHDGLSKLRWPFSAHNATPARAVDLAPLPIDWNDLGSFQKLAATVKGLAEQMQIKVVWGGDWATLKDYDHFQLG